jgi:cysteine desulfurase
MTVDSSLDDEAALPRLPGMPVYLDCHATTPVDPRVARAMWPWFHERFGNAASVNHAYGWQAAEAVERARGQIADLLGTAPASLILTSGATEANNLALKGVMGRAPPGSHLVVSAAEHRAILDPAKKLARRGTKLTIVPVDRFGQVDPQQVADALTPRTVLVSIMLANNEVGTINHLAEIAEICHRRDVLLHCDAAQGVGRISVDLEALPVDLLSLSGHKLYAAQGLGVLYIRRDRRPIPLEPMLEGGGHEQRLRSGTLPVALIVGLGAACQLARELLPRESRRLRELRDRLWSQLRQNLPDLILNGHPDERLPGNLHVSVPGVPGETLMHNLKEIAVSAGAACTTAVPEPSHVLRAMGISETLSLASIRFGLGRFTTETEVDFAAEYFTRVVRDLRRSAFPG